MICKKDKFIHSSGSIQEDFKCLEPDSTVHYINNGQWSLHELLAWCLSITGPADVIVTSFSLSESAIRSFFNLIDTGFIKTLKCLFDVSTRKNKLELLLFAHNVTGKVFLATNHSKIIVISNRDHKVVINSSANLTVNRRYESGLIVTGHDLVESYNDSLTKIFNEAILLNPDELN